MAFDLSKAMHEDLAEHGIELDAPKPNLRIVQKTVSRVGVDREAVRLTLIARGVAVVDLEWLTASCPSLDAARRFTPPRRL